MQCYKMRWYWLVLSAALLTVPSVDSMVTRNVLSLVVGLTFVEAHDVVSFIRDSQNG